MVVVVSITLYNYYCYCYTLLDAFSSSRRMSSKMQQFAVWWDRIDLHLLLRLILSGALSLPAATRRDDGEQGEWERRRLVSGDDDDRWIMSRCCCYVPHTLWSLLTHSFTGLLAIVIGICPPSTRSRFNVLLVCVWMVDCVFSLLLLLPMTTNCCCLLLRCGGGNCGSLHFSYTCTYRTT